MAALVTACHGRCSVHDDREQRVEDFYALDALPSFHLSMSAESERQLRERHDAYVEAEFRYQDQVHRVGLRIKGHRSLRTLDEKPSFKIKFNEYWRDGRFMGQRKLTLNNMVEDPTMLREILGYRLYRALDVPAPNVGYAQVFVNGQLYGLYLMVESIDKRFLKRNFASAKGNLYEGEYGCDLYPEDVPGFDQDSGKDESHADLASFAGLAAGPAQALFHAESAPVDKDSVLAYLAVSAFLGDFDGYRHAHNYRLYHDPSTDKWHLLPWGIDRVMKKGLSIYDSEGLLARRCFEDPRCRVDYLRTMERVAAAFEELDVAQGARAIATWIDPAVRSDPRRPFDEAKIARARGELLEFIDTRPAQVRGEMTCLSDGRENDDDGDGFGCTDCRPDDPAVHPGAAEICDGIDNDCSGLADDDPACGCALAEVDGVTFELCDLPMGWQDAAAYCEGMGKALARVDSPAQSKALYRAARKVRDDRWWIGLSDRGAEGSFVWSDGAALQTGNWSRGEPDNAACHQDCVALKKGGSGRWHDTHCAQHRPFICR